MVKNNKSILRKDKLQLRKSLSSENVLELSDNISNKIINSEVIGTDGQGHGAMAGLLATQSVDVVICGGIGGGAISALEEAGIEVCSGVTGDVDEAVGFLGVA